MTDSTDAAFCNGHAAALCELGVLGVESGGHFAAVRGPRAPVLLAALALAGHRGVATDELIEMIWPSPDQPPAAVSPSRTSCCAYAGRMAHRSSRRLHVDTALAITCSPIGGDFSPTSRERASWSLARRSCARPHRSGPCSMAKSAPGRGSNGRWRSKRIRAHLLQMHASALRLRATALVALNRPESALPTLREVLVADPFDESSRYRLVRLLTDTGQRAEAVGTIHEAGVDCSRNAAWFSMPHARRRFEQQVAERRVHGQLGDGTAAGATH